MKRDQINIVTVGAESVSVQQGSQDLIAPLMCVIVLGVVFMAFVPPGIYYSFFYFISF